MQPVSDERLRLAIDAATEQPGADLAAVHAKGVRSLEGLERYPTLRRLILEGSELSDLTPLAALPQLAELAVRYSRLGDIAVLAQCHEVRHLEMSFCSADDVAPLMTMVSLRTADLVGSPWADDEGRSRGAALRARLDRLWLSIDPDWRLCRRLHESGSGLVFGFRHGRWLLLRPGIPGREGVLCDFVAGARIDLVEEALAKSAARPTTVFTRVRALLQAPVSPDPAADAPIEEGSATDAREWIAGSPLADQPLGAALLRWVAGFETLRWFRRTSRGLAAMGSKDGIELPAWYLTVQGTLAGVEPTTIRWVRLAAPQLAATWFTLAVSTTGFRRCGEILRAHRLLPIAEARTDEARFLAIAADGGPEQPVYIVDDHRDPATPRDKLPRAFDSYVDLLNAVADVQLEDGSTFSRGASARG
jgi:hypothetical protein